MPNIRALIFDLGGTLLHFEGEWPDVYARSDQALFEYLTDQGLALEQAAFVEEFRSRLNDYYIQRERDFIEQTTRSLLRAQLAEMGYSELSEELIAGGVRRLYSISQQHWHLEDDAVRALKTLQTGGYRLGIISNAGDDEDVQSLIDHAGIRDHFDFVISSASQGIRKPNPLIFQTALDRWKLPAAQAAMIGDNLGADILGGQRSGIFSIWITRRADTPANQENAGVIQPDAVIEALSELPSLLAGLKD